MEQQQVQQEVKNGVGGGSQGIFGDLEDKMDLLSGWSGLFDLFIEGIDFDFDFFREYPDELISYVNELLSQLEILNLAHWEIENKIKRLVSVGNEQFGKVLAPQEQEW